MVEYCTVSNERLTELVMPHDVVNRLEAADERTPIISGITSNARSFILVSCLSLGDEHMLKIFRNGLWNVDNNTYYLGRAKIILPPGKPFPKTLPRIVDEAIREKINYNVLVNVHEDDRMTIKYIPGNKRLRSSTDYHRIGDKYVPIVTVPAFSFDSDKRGEFYRDTAK